ncbi:sensor histidine kinase [Sphingomonas sp. Y38-1Y]|uniref:sensor histidine kinase n=1 Tax=Sphingomonas sp. Y38-1Y TaxID=3078265 RepID=UPI0028EAA4D6|nr:ATP-binding protein [Sphingomonas sp. Y38-1Y]
MGFDRRFTAVALGWVVLLGLGLSALAAAIALGGGGATLIVAGAAALGGMTGLLHHVTRTNRALVQFVEALRLGDNSARMARGGGESFAALADALNAAMRDLDRARTRDAAEIRFLEALLDDMPIALLLIEAGSVRLANKAARGLFGGEAEGDAGRLAAPGEPFHAILTGARAGGEPIPLTLPGGTQRAIVRGADLARLGMPVRAVLVEPIQQALDRAEAGAQTAMVRVLTHEILNSLTPIVSLAGTAAVLLGEDPIELDEARLAVETLARRAESTRRFIDSYREMARPVAARRRRFAAEPFAAELARLFTIEWLEHKLDWRVEPGLTIDADPDLLAQALLNLLRNAAQASDARERRRVSLRLYAGAGGAVIEVGDNGPGIPEALRGDVLLPFFTTKAEGSGIGLHLVRQIAIAHGGRLEIATGAEGGALIRLQGF